MRYLAHPVLGPRLRAATQILWDLDNVGKDMASVLGHDESLVANVKSCITLFATMSLGEDSVFFMRVLDKVWNGKSCGMTLQILDAWVNKSAAQRRKRRRSAREILGGGVAS